VELPKVPPHTPAADSPAVLRWSRFLAASSDDELEQLAMTDPDLRDAKTALENLSRDPTARRLAEERERAAWNHRYTMAQQRKAGRQEGLLAGRQEGRTETLRHTVERLAQTLGVPLAAEQRAFLDAADPEAMQLILDHLALYRQWPS